MFQNVECISGKCIVESFHNERWGAGVETHFQTLCGDWHHIEGSFAEINGSFAGVQGMFLSMLFCGQLQTVCGGCGGSVLRNLVYCVVE